MATLETPEDRGRVVLQIYAHFNSQPGKELGSRNFLAVGGRRRIEASDLQRGLEYAAKVGWIEAAEHGWRLTELGFGEMPQPSVSH